LFENDRLPASNEILLTIRLKLSNKREMALPGLA
jgi:hypothetical protein